MNGYEDLPALVLPRVGGDGDKKLTRFPSRLPVEQVRLEVIRRDGNLVPHIGGARRNVPRRSAFCRAFVSVPLHVPGPAPLPVPAPVLSRQHTKAGNSCMKWINEKMSWN